MLAIKFLDVLIGLAFIYTVVCLLVAGMNELLAQWAGRRGKFLRSGLLRLVPDEALYLRLIHHPSIASIYRGPVGKDHPPSYLDGRIFAQTLVDVLLTRTKALGQQPAATGAKSFQDLYAAVTALNDRDVATTRALAPILDRAQGDYEKALVGIQAWFDEGMNRVSGWYKRATFGWMFGLGLFVSIGAGLDSIELTRWLWQSDAARTALASQAALAIKDGRVAGVPLDAAAQPPSAPQTKELAAILASLESAGAPVGFKCWNAASGAISDSAISSSVSRCIQVLKDVPAADWPLRIIGMLLSALAISLGAPFWFEFLGRFVSVRGGGPKPDSGQSAITLPAVATGSSP